ncbi:MAG: PDZ domain-containing protein [Candidatus Omnitrophica bacterium]|nr:PDZ domain-containing protein [Candidatus Omnitrophota bacterium]
MKAFGFFALVTAVTVFIILVFKLNSSADTVVLKNNAKEKGVVVEEYGDRVILSTIDGEKTLMKSDIQDIIYDLEEQNLTKLGDYYQDKRMYSKARYYYEKALKINSKYKPAQNGMNFVSIHMQQTDSLKKMQDISRLNIEEGWTKNTKKAGDDVSNEGIIDKDLGLKFKTGNGTFEIKAVREGSPAYAAELRKGDKVLAIWGRGISYMEPKEVLERLVSIGSMDVQLTLERKCEISLPREKKNYSDALGLKFSFSEMDGLKTDGVREGSLAAKTGIKDGDILTEIEGKKTRYMPLDEVIGIVGNCAGKKVTLTVKRDVSVWKKIVAK